MGVILTGLAASDSAEPDLHAWADGQAAMEGISRSDVARRALIRDPLGPDRFGYVRHGDFQAHERTSNHEAQRPSH
jgi:hypothetical protein